RNAFHVKTNPQPLTTEELFKKDSTINVHQVDINKPKKKKNDFWKCFDEFVKVNGKLNDWTPATHEKFAALRNHLTGFDKKLTFDKFDEEGISNFIDYLGKNGMKNSTINKQLGFLRWFLRWCYEKDYHANRTFEYYKPKLKNASKRVVFLTADELSTLETFKIPAKHVALGPIRDVFLFTCYTGLRYSDACNLTWDDIHNGKIEIVTVKTSDRILIEINSKAQAILDKYADIHLPDKKVLPVISNQKMNKHLHTLCKLAGIDESIKTTHYEGNKRIDKVQPKYELIGTHCGRRTFICTALAKGIPPSVVMKWTGHSDYKAMKPYIDIADEVKSEYMKQFDE
ncbi:MAG: tyrosine-type recombinase/integrase, partial [Prevotella salivae]|nr:tyrosine-type recombinase/integrase [Segatella salivae]